MSKVLLVEDDERISMALGIRMRAYGHNITQTQDAYSAYDWAISSTPDIILLDINLPGRDGFELAQILRETDNVSSTPIVFITASKNYAYREKASKIGASGFLEKPFDSIQLAYVIDQILNQEITMSIV